MKKIDLRKVNTQDYRDAVAGQGPRAYDWKDKPHRLIYDLCTAIEQLQADAESLYQDELEND